MSDAATTQRHHDSGEYVSFSAMLVGIDDAARAACTPVERKHVAAVRAVLAAAKRGTASYELVARAVGTLETIARRSMNAGWQNDPSRGGSRKIKVASKSEPGKSYTVKCDAGAWSCSCTGFAYRKTCSHVAVAQKEVGK